jgi:hypothetical protein
MRLLADAGPGENELAEAAGSGALGILALDLALRPAGQMVTLAEAAQTAGVTLEEATALWRMLGFAVPDDGTLRLTSAEAGMLRSFVALSRQVVGEERLPGFARVLGWATAVLGEALVDAFRVEVEVPRLGAGARYAEIVEQYAGETAQRKARPDAESARHVRCECAGHDSVGRVSDAPRRRALALHRYRRLGCCPG